LFSAVPGRFVSDELGSKSLLLVGVTVFAMFAGASLAQLFVVRIGAGRAMLIGLTILPLGLGALVLALVTTSIVLFVVSAVLAGHRSRVLIDRSSPRTRTAPSPVW
jgi:hypothetical protein